MKSTRTAGRFLEHGRQVHRDARSLGDSVEGMLSDAQALVLGGLDRSPYTTLGAAAAFGFVVGGGLSGRLLPSIALASGRAIASAALQGALLRMLVPEVDGGVDTEKFGNPGQAAEA